MNRVPVIVRNPAYVVDVELDEDEVYPADLTPLVRGNTPIVTVPASEDEDEDEEMEDVPQILRDVVSSMEELNQELRSILSPYSWGHWLPSFPCCPRIEVWDTGRAWEREYRLYPE